MSNEEFRCGSIGLIGLPNAGKSTLLNSALGQKLSIISSKPQTTRNRILGIYQGDNVQIALVDTPGIHRPKGRLHKIMVRSAQEVIEEVDSTLSDDEGFAPFRLYAFGPFNLRGQRIGSKSSYRTFVGNEKK